MANRNQSAFWEDNNVLGINQPFESSSKGYLDDQSILNNFSLSQQGGDATRDSMRPIGLRLKKTPSLLDMVQTSVANANNRSESERVKAGNIPAASIKIGNWQKFSRHEGDLIAKLYYTRRKLVWEVLEGAVKYKIEIQWSDISAIRVITPENQLGTLEVELNQPPLHFRETTSQQRKHTVWEQASDFTGGQTLVWRRHIVSFKSGILDKHYEKLLQFNQRFFEMSMKPFPSHECPYFDPTFENSKTSLREPPVSLLPNSSISAINMAYTNDGENMSSNYANMDYQYQYAPVMDEFCSNNVPDQQYSNNNEALNAPVTNEFIFNNAVAQQYTDNNEITNYAPATTDAFCPDNMSILQYSDNKWVTNYQGSSHLNPYYYPS